MNFTTKKIVFHSQEKQCAHLFLGMPLLLFFFFTVCHTIDLQAQRVSVKTNMVDWTMVSPNLSMEFIVSNRLSIDLSATATPFKLKEDLYFRQIRLQPELRYWLMSPLAKHYVGLTAFYSSYDVGVKSRGYFGDSFAVGVTYGYNWILSRRWNFELCGGLGLIHYRMARYTLGEARQTPNKARTMIMPVKLGVSFIYVLK